MTKRRFTPSGDVAQFRLRRELRNIAAEKEKSKAVAGILARSVRFDRSSASNGEWRAREIGHLLGWYSLDHLT